MKKVLVIDSDPTVSDELAIHLREHGLSVIAAADGKSGVRKALEESPRLIVLEVVLPDMSGFDLCKILNSNPVTKTTPIIFLSAKANEVDRILGFELGAVDYVTKPFSAREVLLRVRAIVRHDHGYKAEQQLMSREILLNQTQHQVAVNGKQVTLTAVEFRLLSYLMKTRGRVQDRDRLLNEVWDYSSNMLQTRTVDNHVLRLRKKLGKAGSSIETVRGYGYRFQKTEGFGEFDSLSASRFGLPLVSPGGRQMFRKASRRTSLTDRASFPIRAGS